jgi:lipopolysaccharide/colanic/teichoic acid biosynthesis glycosyltransferase
MQQHQYPGPDISIGRAVHPVGNRPAAIFPKRASNAVPSRSPSVSTSTRDTPSAKSEELVSASWFYLAAKRTFDLVLAMLFTGLALPLLPLLALAIKLDSPGPVFYSQIRVGHNGGPFRIYKLRSMSSDAERNGAVWAREADPRVTRVGRFLRRSRMDELPQLWNVVRGDMSFVGPRPERPEFTSILEVELPDYGDRYAVKPGLTGWAQIRYRYASSIQDSATKLEYDLYYVQHRSTILDIRILVLTIPVVLNLRGH